MKILLLFLCGTLMVACHSRNKADSLSAKIYFTDSDYTHLIPLAENHMQIDEAQHIEASFAEKNFSADSWLQINDSTISIFIFGSFGNTLAEIHYQNDSISFNSNVIDPQKVKPEYIIADIQLCFYELSTLKKHYEPAGFSITEIQKNNETERTLTKGSLTIAIISRNKDFLTFKNLLRNYTYQIFFNRT